MSEVKVGDRVRSFHFEDRSLEGERACYVEGVVLATGRFGFPDCDRYKIAVDREVFGGELVEVPDGHMVYPPLNGTPTWHGRVMDGVVKL